MRNFRTTSTGCNCDATFRGPCKVIQITNNSSHHLYNVRAFGCNFKGFPISVRATDELRPESMVEVGWFEFTNWVPRSGETVEVYCDNYVSPMIKIIP
jgi:hypothetical protein